MLAKNGALNGGQKFHALQLWFSRIFPKISRIFKKKWLWSWKVSDFSIFWSPIFFLFFANISRTIRLTEKLRILHCRSEILRSTTSILLNSFQNFASYEKSSFQVWKSAVKILWCLVKSYRYVIVSISSRFIVTTVIIRHSRIKQYANNLSKNAH